MLLDHTSGFPNLRFLEPDRKLRIHFEPGTKYAYSGEGMQLLQLVVETITHEPLTRLMDERVFRPLGMTHTSMVWQDRSENDFANGYDEYGRSLGPQKWKTAGAAGSMLTTAGDYARLLEAMFTRHEMLSLQIRIHSKHQFQTDAWRNSGDRTPAMIHTCRSHHHLTVAADRDVQITVAIRVAQGDSFEERPRVPATGKRELRRRRDKLASVFARGPRQL